MYGHTHRVSRLRAVPTANAHQQSSSSSSSASSSAGRWQRHRRRAREKKMVRAGAGNAQTPKPLELGAQLRCKWREGEVKNCEVIERKLDEDTNEWKYYVHYEGLNRRLDEWVALDRFDLGSVSEEGKMTRTQKRKLDHEEQTTFGSRSKSNSCLGPSARLGFEPRAAYDALRPHGTVEVAHVVLVLIAHVEHHRSGLGRVLGSGEHLSPRLGLQVLACLG